MRKLLFLFLLCPLAHYAQAQDSPAALVQNGPQCTEVGWYKRTCDQAWQFVNPAKAGDIIPSGCAAHTEMIYGGNGAQYALIDQCPQGCVGYQGLYKKPDDATAAARWAYYYTDPDAALHRQIKGYIGPGVPPPGFQTYTLITLAQMPNPPRATFQNAYGCNGAPTPTPLPAPTPTPAPNPFARYVVWVTDKGIMAGCGGNLFCPGTPVSGLLTRAQITAILYNTYKMDHPSEPLPECRQIYFDVVCP